jgi:hypothetical protein
LAERIIFYADGENEDYELDSPFVYLRSLVKNLSTPENGEGGSEQIREGASISQKPPTDDVEWFLPMLRFDSRRKVNALTLL